MFQNCMDIVIRCLGRQSLVHCQTWWIILAQFMLGTLMMVLLDGCSLILLNLSLNSTDLLLDEIDLLTHDSTPSAIATLLFSRVFIALILVNRMVILVLSLRGLISYESWCFISVAQVSTDRVSHTQLDN